VAMAPAINAAMVTVARILRIIGSVLLSSVARLHRAATAGLAGEPPGGP
jgi:hypothetical protein